MDNTQRAITDLARKIEELSGVVAALEVLVMHTEAFAKTDFLRAQATLSQLAITQPTALIPGSTHPLAHAAHELERIKSVVQSLEALRSAGGSG